MRRAAEHAAKAVVGAILVALTLRHVDRDTFAQALSSTDLRLFFAAVLLTLMNVLVTALRSHVLTRPFATLSYREALRLVLIAGFFNVFVPGGIAGDVVRGLEARKHGLASEHAFGSVITDRLMGLVSLVALSAAGLLFRWRLLLSSGLLPHVFAACGAVLVPTAVLYSTRLGGVLVRALGLVGRGGRLARLLDGLRQYRSCPRVLVAAFAISVVSQGLMTASVYLLARAVGGEASFVPFLVIVPIVGILTALPVTIGGLGIRDAGYVLLLPLVGLTRAQALGTSFLFFGTIVLAALAGGLAYLWPGHPPAATPLEPEPATVAPREEA